MRSASNDDPNGFVGATIEERDIDVARAVGEREGKAERYIHGAQRNRFQEASVEVLDSCAGGDLLEEIPPDDVTSTLLGESLFVRIERQHRPRAIQTDDPERLPIELRFRKLGHKSKFQSWPRVHERRIPRGMSSMNSAATHRCRHPGARKVGRSGRLDGVP